MSGFAEWDIALGEPGGFLGLGADVLPPTVPSRMLARSGGSRGAPARPIGGRDENGNFLALELWVSLSVKGRIRVRREPRRAVPCLLKVAE